MGAYQCECGNKAEIPADQEGRLAVCPKCKREFFAPSSKKAIDETCAEIELYIKSGYPLLYIVSHEEKRVLEALQGIARRLARTVRVWTSTKGFAGQKADGVPTQVATAALDSVASAPGASISVLCDFHTFLREDVDGSYVVIRKMRDVLNAISGSDRALIILSPSLILPQEIDKAATVVEFPVPCYNELFEHVKTRIIPKLRSEIVTDAGGGDKDTDIRMEGISVKLSDKEIDEIVRSLQGLTLDEAEHAVRKSAFKDNKLDAHDLSNILAEKGQIVKKSGALEFYPPQETLDHVGGLELLKQWLRVKHRAFSSEARAAGVDAPRGLLLIGVPGCGKSLTAKAISSLWRLPLLRFDVGRVFSKWIGQSEENMRGAIKLSECLAPCILWIDEIEKGFSGLGASDSADGGVTARVLSTFLTWMQEKKQTVFVVATANQVRRLPPEFMRKGRFDEIFYVDLPMPPERRDIAAIHIAKRKKDPTKFDLDKLATASEGYTGADIEAAVKEAAETAFADSRECTTDLIMEVMKRSVPLSVTMKEDIAFLRQWQEGRARPASARKP